MKLFWSLILISISSLVFSFFIKPTTHKVTTTKSPAISPNTKQKQIITSEKKISPEYKKTFEDIEVNNTPTTPVLNENPTSNAVLTNTPIPTSKPEKFQITVSINGASHYSISLPPNATHCDVLTQSLTEGKITSLNMKYDSTYKSYGVYQINGVGKENQVWWTYKINGSSVPRGCSHIKVENNDTVLWSYIGPN